VNGSVPLLGDAVVPSTPFVDAGAVEAAGEVVAAGAADFAGAFGVDDFCAACTPLLVEGDVFETLLLFVVTLLVTELFVVELFVTELLTLVFVVDDVLVAGVAGFVVWLHDAVVKLFTACQSFMCRLPGHTATLCGWLLPGP
jgi:hypothetical protein